MKKFIFIVLLSIINFTTYSQKSNHIISGLDLNKDWFSLTNFSVLTYYTQQSQNEEQPYVFSDFEYYYDKIDKDFLNIGFTSLKLGFPKNQQSNLNNLPPSILFAFLNYSSLTEYENNNKNDFAKISSILIRQFGAPNSSVKASWGASFEWKFENAQMILNSTSNDNQIILSYLK